MKLLVAIFVSALAISSSFAYDPSPLQDICVAINDPKKAVFVNGKFCKNPDDVTADDFLFQGLNIPRDTNNKLGSNVTAVFVDQIAGLNTLGIAVGRVDFGPYGLNPPHLHPRGSEILTVMEGELYAGFVTSNQLGNKLFAKVLKPGDAIVFPIGLIHFQLNVGKTKAVAMVSFSSQSPGITTIGNDLFGSKPPINPDVLTKAFQLDKKVIHYLQSQFWLDNSS